MTHEEKPSGVMYRPRRKVPPVIMELSYCMPPSPLLLKSPCTYRRDKDFFLVYAVY
jgi:hypothetical protein